MPDDQIARIGARGQVVIPASIRRLLGLQTGETVVFRVDDQRNVTVSPAVVIARRSRVPVKQYSQEEVAQLLIDSAYTSEEEEDARKKIASMGLNPDNFRHYEPDV